MVFNQLPTKSGFDTKAFYSGELCMNQDSCMVIAKNDCHFGVPQAQSDKLSPAKQVLLLGGRPLVV